MQSHTNLFSVLIRWRLPIAIAGCCLAASGCGHRPPFDLVPVSGRVQYTDGTPVIAPSIELVFIPAIASVTEEGIGSRSARARADGQTGAFDSATTWSSGDGAIAGKNQVLVIARDQKGRPHPAVPGKYASPSTTPLLVDVAPANIPLTIQIERVQKGRR